MIGRRQFITLLGGSAAAWPLAARAQQPAMPVIGFLNGGTAAAYAPYVTAFRHGLAAAGYIEDRDVAIEYRWAEGQYDRAPALATDLVRRQVALICVTASTALVQATKAATSTIPIVFAIGADPVKFGLVASLNRPGGNVTGVSFLANLLAAKQLEVLHEAAPNATAVAFLVNPRNPNAADRSSEAKRLGLELTVASAGAEDAIDKAFATLVREQARAVLIGADPLFTAHRERVALLAERHRLPTIFIQREFPKVGGLMSYGPDQTDAYQQTGAYAGRILRGEKPADLPVVQPTKFELVINLKTAKALGLDVPPTLIARADEVIE
jgi:putative tryptophan/tyrosine transport system substrate-binding protein